ncbi:MAG: hypothetical protein LBI33_05640 [Propionibacteriaceae bacterium]|nr:hypothetical protein [Propionibacteriaceae bacterium]
MKLTLRRVAAAGLAGLAAVALAGCTKDTGLPTLGTTGPATSLDAVAKAFQSCMTDAGINTELQPNYEGKLTLVTYVGYRAYVYRYGDGILAMSGYDLEGGAVDLPPAVEAFMTSHDTTPGLILDGVDKSEPYVQCLTKSGYDEASAQGQPSGLTDPRQFQVQVEANNKWASCARDNGFPTIKDSQMPASLDGAPWPTITLPGTITPSQLRQLLAACPNFDPAQMKLIEEWWAENQSTDKLPDGYLPNPDISFDIPDIDTSNPDRTPTPEELAQADRLTELHAILQEGINAYYASR